jgi:peptidoglycan/xylan/chitin deacetylase (PgdA/CDA1 family)
MLDAGEAIRKLALNVARLTRLAPLARPLVGGVGAILMLHRVTARPERPDGVNRHLAICPTFLDRLIVDIRSHGYDFVTLDEAIARLSDGASGPPVVTLTADDAYRDNLTEALPVLERHGVPITIYVAPALIDGTSFLWWDVVEEIVERNARVTVPGSPETVLDADTPTRKFSANGWLHDFFGRVLPEKERHAVLALLAAAHGVDPDRPRRETLMDWSELATAARHPLVTIGAHTINHFNLRRLSETEVREEMDGARTILETRLGAAPRHLAYPYGYASAVGQREVALAAACGFASAVTTRHGVLVPGHAQHLHALPRISVNGRYQRVAHIHTMLSGITTPLANSGRRLVTV